MKKLAAVAIALALASQTWGEPILLNEKVLRASISRAFAPALYQLTGMYAEDTPHVSGHFGTMVMGVRRDTPTSLAGADNDYLPFTTDSLGRLWVNNSSVSQIVIGQTPDGSATATNPVLVAGQDGTNVQSIKTDITGSVQVDIESAPTLTVDSELPAAAAASDNFANPTAPSTLSHTMLWDSATWDRAPGNSTDGALVNLGANNDVTVTGTVTANAGTGNFNVVGTKSNNTGAPGSTNLGTLPGVATVAAPTYTEGNQVALSTNLIGELRVTGGGGGTEFVEDLSSPADPAGGAVLLRRRDAPAGEVTTAGDWVAANATNFGAQFVQVVNSSGSFVDTFGGGTQYTEGDVDASITGTATMWEDAADTLRAVSVAKPLPTRLSDGVDQINVSGTGKLEVTCDNCGAPPTFEDNDAFTFNTTAISNIGFVVDDVGVNSILENSAGNPRMTSTRVPYTTVDLPRVVQENDVASTGSVSSLPLAFPANLKAGNSVIVLCSVGNGTEPTVTDTQALSYERAVFIANGATFNTGVYYAVASTGAANTVTCANNGAAASMTLVIYEVSGFIQPTATYRHNVLDAVASATSGAATTSPAVSVAPQSPNQLSFASFALGTAAQTITVAEPYANDSGQLDPTTPAGLFSAVGASNLLSTLLASAPSATVGTGEPWAVAVATFKAVIEPSTAAVGGLAADGAAATGHPVRIAGKDGSGNVQDVATDTAGELQIDVLTLPSVTIGTFPDNEPFNVAQFGGSAVVTGTGASGAGIPRVTVSNDSTVTANAGTGTFTVAGAKSDNGGAPGATNLGTLPAVALAADPTRTEGNQVALRTQLDGDLVTAMVDELPAGTQNIGDVDVASLPNEGQQTAANSISTTIDTDNDWIGATGAAPPGEAGFIGGLASGATGGFLQGITVCDSFVNINVSTATTTLLVTGVSGRHVRICSMRIMVTGAQTAALISGTGATCGTGTTGMGGGTTAATGFLQAAANGGMTQGSGLGEIDRTNATGDSVCIVTGAATQTSGRISYTIY